MRSGAGTGARLRRFAPWRWSVPVRLAWQASFTALFALLVLRSVDFDELGDSIAGIKAFWVLPALLLFTTAKYIDSWRWRYLLRGLDASLPQRALFGAFLIGNMINNLLPLRVGDVAKIQVLANRYGASRAALAASVFIVEASLDGLVFVLFLLAAFAFGDIGELSTVSGAAVLSLGVIALAAFGVALLLSRRVAGHEADWFSRLPSPARGPAARLAEQAHAGLEALRAWPRTAGAVALSAPAWLVEAGVFALFGQAFDLGLSYPTFIAVMVAANLAVAIPIALWNFGPYEALVSGVLIAAGVDQSTALSYAISVHLLTNLWIVGTGLAAFWALGVRPRQVFAIDRPGDGDGRIA